MDIMELGAIGELVGGVAVIGSLLYVGLQVRQSNRLTQADSVQSIVQGFNRDVLSPLQDQTFGTIVRRGMNNFHDLTKDEQVAIDAQLSKMIGLGQSVFFLQRHGMVHEDFALARQAIDAAIIKTPGGAQWWAVVRQVYPPDYVAHLDRLLEDYEGPAVTELLPWFAPDEPTLKDA